MKIADNIYLKDDITAGDVLAVYRFIKYAESDNSNKIYYYKEILKKLTNLKRPSLMDLTHIEKVLKEAEIISDKKPAMAMNDPVSEIRKTFIRISAMTGIPLLELENNIPFKYINDYVLEVNKNKLIESRSRVYEYHSPKDFLDEIRRNISKINSHELFSKTKDFIDNETPNDYFAKINNSLLN